MPKEKYFALWNLSAPYPPSLMFPVLRATILGMSKILDSDLKKGFVAWQNGKSSYFFKEKELFSTIDKLIKKALIKPEYLYKIFKIGLSRSVKMNNFSKNFKNGLDKKQLLELFDLYKKFDEIFFDFYSYAAILALMGYKDDNSLYKKMEEILRLKTKKNPEKYADYLNSLTAFPKKLKNNFFEIEVYKLAAESSRLGLHSASEIKKKFKDGISTVLKKYQWLSFDFTDKISWTDSSIAELILEKISFDVKKNLDELNNYEKRVKKLFKNACLELKLREKEIKIFELVRDIGYYKWARENEFQESIYNLKKLQDEIAKRKKIKPLEARYVLISELERLNGGELKILAGERMKSCFVEIGANGGVKELFGKSAKEALRKIKFSNQEKTSLKSDKIVGMPARAGFAKGRVKIINFKNEVSKMDKGDVLVSMSTYPELISAMKKASAIVTDVGGIICHAAIVSRELDIPCVVGTKIATQVLKDGDMVEVDADRGIVKIIK